MLEVTSLRLAFGGVAALRGVSWTARPGEIASIVGPNGAGKTALFNCVTGFYRPSSGSIRFNGRELVGLRPSAVVASGIARTFQNLRAFGEMSAEDNVRAGALRGAGQRILGALLGTPRSRRTVREGIDEAHRWLDFVGFRGNRDNPVTSLPYGDQRLVEIARALATKPSLILLDEPGAGLNHTEKLALGQVVRRIRDRDITVVLIEHDVSLVMRVSDRVSVLNFGTLIADGTPDEVRRSPAVIDAYLGVGDDSEPTGDLRA